ncbi:hypothetical protein [Hallella colorans]|uniref:hypothetical protein n=1 Tax=Hallella colorans TaxID=1703337 RepID=UPI0023F070EF|nr:hypothetical protein [Hallella colorans]
MSNKILSRGQITIVDLNDAKQISMILQVKNPSQMYNPDTKVYTPNFTTDKNTVTPKVYVTGSGQNMVNALTSIEYDINGTKLQAGKSAEGYSVGAISAGAVLTIATNIISNTLNINVKATYHDILTNIDTVLEAQTQVIKSTSAGALLQVVLTQPKGNCFETNITELTAHAECYRGGVLDTSIQKLQWQKLNFANGLFEDISTGVETSGGQSTLTVHADDVLNVQTYKVIATDDGQTSEAIVTFEDRTDPYELVLHAPKGNVIVNGKGEVDINAEVWQNGVKLEDASAQTPKFFYTWTKYNKAGARENFTGTSSPTKTGNPLKVLAADVDQKATFVCEVTKV